jgi:hypothetical protein
MYEDKIAVSEGFQSKTLPIKDGAEARFPPMAVKLKGDIAAMKPLHNRETITIRYNFLNLVFEPTLQSSKFHIIGCMIRNI